MTASTDDLPRIILLGPDPDEPDAEDYPPDAVAMPAARADLYEQMGQLDRALACRKEALRAAEELGVPAWQRAQLGRLGALHLKASQPDQAIECIHRALALPYADDVSRETRLNEEAVLLGLLGHVQREVDPAAALDSLLEARRRYRELGDERWAHQMTGHLGEIYARLKRPAEAIACYEEVLPRTRAEEEFAQLLIVLRALAMLYPGTSDPRAMAYAEEALALAVELGDEGAERDMLTLQGLLCARAGDAAGARARHERALHLGRLSGQPEDVVSTLIDLSTAQMELRDWRAARRTLEELVPLLERSGPPEKLATLECNLGHVLQRLDDLPGSVPHLQKGWDGLRRRGMTEPLGSVGVDLGLGYLRTGRAREAVGVLREAVQHLRRHGGPGQKLMAALEFLGEAHLALKDYASAHAVMEDLLGVVRRVGDQKDLLLALHQAAGTTFYLKRWTQALRLAEEELQVARGLGDREGEANALYSMGVIHGELRHMPKATELVQAALSIFAELGSPQVALAREALQAWRVSS